MGFLCGIVFAICSNHAKLRSRINSAKWVTTKNTVAVFDDVSRNKKEK